LASRDKLDLDVLSIEPSAFLLLCHTNAELVISNEMDSSCSKAA
jgi:hypothetical protein